MLGAGAFWAVRSVDTDPAAAATVTVGTGEVCNGHAELCGRRYDEVSYVTTHNAMSAADEPGWFLAEQPHGLTSQLDGGARAAMIDVWAARPAGRGVSSLSVNLEEGRAQLEEAFGEAVVESSLRLVEAVVGPASGPAALYMCHGLCEIGATELAPTLGALRAWLDANPDEVVTLIVENHVPADEIGQAFEEAGLEPYLYTPTDGQWPTLAQMITSGRRLVVMTEEDSGGTAHPWLRNAFELTQDTPYTFPTPDDFSCAPNRGPADAPLLLVNHWLSGFDSLVTAAQTVNVADVLGDAGAAVPGRARHAGQLRRGELLRHRGCRCGRRRPQRPGSSRRLVLRLSMRQPARRMSRTVCCAPTSSAAATGPPSSRRTTSSSSVTGTVTGASSSPAAA